MARSPAGQDVTSGNYQSTRRRQGEINRKAALGYDWERLADRVRDEYCAAIEERALGRAGRRLRQQALLASRESTT